MGGGARGSMWKILEGNRPRLYYHMLLLEPDQATRETAVNAWIRLCTLAPVCQHHHQLCVPPRFGPLDFNFLCALSCSYSEKCVDFQKLNVSNYTHVPLQNATSPVMEYWE